MNNTIREKSAEIAKQGYSTDLLKEKTTDGDFVFIAINPELENCMAQGETPQEALEALEEVRIDYIEHLLEFNLPIPYPKQALTKDIVGKPIMQVTVTGITFPGFEDFRNKTVKSDERRIFSVSSNA
jgi:predicted RNase H-like HicB family nuclease